MSICAFCAKQLTLAHISMLYGLGEANKRMYFCTSSK